MYLIWPEVMYLLPSQIEKWTNTHGSASPLSLLRSDILHSYTLAWGMSQTQRRDRGADVRKASNNW
jgi:hypothetical protein